ncbi:MAG: DsbA family protein [Pseudomonadota bacterium]
MLTRRHFSLLAASTSLALAAPQAFAQAKAEPLPDVILGDENAPVTIIEYASMTCPHCASFHNGTFKDLKTEYIDTGQVKFILREFPFDPLAAAVFMLARCSDDRYYDVVDLFFETQRQWATQDALPKIRNLALQAGFTNESFEACLTDQKLLDGINAVKEHGYETYGVSATPTIFVDGERFQGPRTMRGFREVIDPKLGS